MSDSDQDDVSDDEAAPWYRSGLSFECTGCGNCCSGPQTGYVWVVDQEIRDLANYLEESDVDRFEHRFVRKVGSRKSLVEYSDGDCIFLDPKKKGCMVYPVRPSQCRTWPFWNAHLESPHAWGKAASSCPGCNRGRLYTLSEIRSLAKGESGT